MPPSSLFDQEFYLRYHTNEEGDLIINPSDLVDHKIRMYGYKVHSHPFPPPMSPEPLVDKFTFNGFYKKTNVDLEEFFVVSPSELKKNKIRIMGEIHPEVDPEEAWEIHNSKNPGVHEFHPSLEISATSIMSLFETLEGMGMNLSTDNLPGHAEFTVRQQKSSSVSAQLATPERPKHVLKPTPSPNTLCFRQQVHYLSSLFFIVIVFLLFYVQRASSECSWFENRSEDFTDLFSSNDLAFLGESAGAQPQAFQEQMERDRSTPPSLKMSPLLSSSQSQPSTIPSLIPVPRRKLTFPEEASRPPPASSGAVSAAQTPVPQPPSAWQTSRSAVDVLCGSAARPIAPLPSVYLVPQRLSAAPRIQSSWTACFSPATPAQTGPAFVAVQKQQPHLQKPVIEPKVEMIGGVPCIKEITLDGSESYIVQDSYIRTFVSKYEGYREDWYFIRENDSMAYYYRYEFTVPKKNVRVTLSKQYIRLERGDPEDEAMSTESTFLLSCSYYNVKPLDPERDVFPIFFKSQQSYNKLSDEDKKKYVTCSVGPHPLTKFKLPSSWYVLEMIEKRTLGDMCSGLRDLDWLYVCRGEDTDYRYFSAENYKCVEKIHKEVEEAFLQFAARRNKVAAATKPTSSVAIKGKSNAGSQKGVKKRKIEAISTELPAVPKKKCNSSAGKTLSSKSKKEESESAESSCSSAEGSDEIDLTILDDEIESEVEEGEIVGDKKRKRVHQSGRRSVKK